jgi:hypothetical protein
MKNLYIAILLVLSINTYAGSGLLVVKALGDTDSNGVNEYSIFSRDTSTGTETLLKTFESPYDSCAGCSFVNEYEGKFYLGGAGGFAIYDIATGEVSLLAQTDGTLLVRQNVWDGEAVISTGTDAEDNSSTTILGSLDISDKNGNTLIEQNSDGTSIEIGEDSSGETGLIITNTAESLDITDGDGETVIEKKADGSVHIGENSLVTVEENGVQQLYATNVSDEQININIKKGTDLLIDGVSVAGSLSTNATNIATNTTDIATNKTSIATNTTDIATNKTSIATNTTSIATNTTDIATNKTSIATNKTSIATNVTNIAANTAEIATYTDSIAGNTTAIAALGSDLNAYKASTNSQMNYMKSDYSSGIASAVAMSQFNLAQDGFSIGVGRGSYNDEMKLLLVWVTEVSLRMEHSLSYKPVKVVMPAELD